MTFDDPSLSAPDPDISVWRESYTPKQKWPSESALPASALLPSPWLEQMWSQARAQSREAAWNVLPDRIGDAVERGEPLTPGDIAFLRERSADRSRTLAAAVAALRTLGRLCEDQSRWVSDAAPAFCHALQEPIAGLRYAAVEAIWQARILSAIPVLSAALELEKDEPVREMLEHVLRILR